MQGFIRPRGASWELRVYLGTDPVTGRQRYANRSVRGPRHRAERVLKEMIAAAQAGATHQAEATFGELAETWLRHARAHLAPAERWLCRAGRGTRFESALERVQLRM